jgi:hypothetical protein
MGWGMAFERRLAMAQTIGIDWPRFCGAFLLRAATVRARLVPFFPAVSRGAWVIALNGLRRGLPLGLVEPRGRLLRCMSLLLPITSFRHLANVRC